MRNKLGFKLSTKILATFLVASIVIFNFIAYSVDKIIKVSSYEAEKQKATLILEGISSELAMSMYLGLYSQTLEQAKTLLKYNEVLSIRVYLADGRLLGEHFTDNVDMTKLETSIKTSLDIKDSITKHKLATIEISYSNNNYLKLIDGFRSAALEVVVASVVMLLVVLVFIEYLLMPLRDISNKMRDYQPGKTIDFDIIEHQNEIGMIVSAFKKMQANIYDYSEQLNDVNKMLEQKVQDKTKELSNAFYFDSLTKLPNRNKLLEEMESKEFILVLLNIDDFKEVNDFYGLSAGDEILAGVGSWLASCGYDAYRLSGDEFAVLFDAKMDKNWLVGHIDRLHDELHSTFFIHGDEYIQLSATFGVSMEKDDALSKADIALHLAKNNKDAIGIYSKDLQVEERYQYNIKMTSIIKNALEDGRVIAFYQPIMDTTKDKIVKYETLIRIVDNNGKILPPSEFLPIAQKGRFYPELTKRVVALACDMFKNRDEEFSVNISVADILSTDTMEYILNCVDKCGVGNKIIFEILESEGIENLAEVSHFIKEAKKMGAKIAVDDFGTGYSNFENILKLQVDYLKIDGSLIKNINRHRESRVIVETIVDFAKKLGIAIVAEYVCSEDIYETVKALGIESAQGYFVGKPEPL